MPDAGFYFSWYQMFKFLIFAATRRSILCLLIYNLTYYIKKLYLTMDTKRKFVKVTLKKYKFLQEI